MKDKKHILSDEDIINQAKKYQFSTPNTMYIEKIAFSEGAKWVRDKYIPPIINQD